MKLLTKLISVLLVGTTLFGMAGCSADFGNNDIAQKVDGSVSFPAQYSIAYEVKTSDGEIRTVKKSVDSEGNIYFCSDSEETLFIKDGKHYALYQKQSGIFTANENSAVYDSIYVDAATSELLTYAERSKQQFLPGMKDNGEKEVLNRTCLVYSVGVGYGDTGITYSVLIDKETGICLGWDETKEIFGNNERADGEIFICTEFITENVPTLKGLIENSSAN